MTTLLFVAVAAATAALIIIYLRYCRTPPPRLRSLLVCVNCGKNEAGNDSRCGRCRHLQRELMQTPHHLT